MTSAEFFSILVIAIGLSADCFAVALSTSIATKALAFWPVSRVSISFGIFQAVMPLLGWLVGRTVVDLIAPYDHWVAFALLAGVGGHMIYESFRPAENPGARLDRTSGIPLLILSIATSIDALAVGLSFAFLKANIALASLTIGVVALVITAVGFLLGKRFGRLAGERAETIGGLILIGIGIKIVLSHLL
jgi:putative Mn2+ efflux pump MntP